MYASLDNTMFNDTFKTGCDDYFYFNAKSFQLYKDIPINITTTTEPISFDINGTETNTSDAVLNDTLGQNFLPLYEEWRKYYQVAVSLNASVVHVPTNIYECGM